MEEKKSTKINVFGSSSEEEPVEENIDVKSLAFVEEDPPIVEEENIGVVQSFKNLFSRKKKLQATSTLAHVICNYSYNGQTVEDISSVLKIDSDVVIGCIEEAKDAGVFEKLALEYENF